MARQPQNPAAHPTDRLLGNAPSMRTLRAQIRHLATFDLLGSAFVLTLLLQGETGTGKGLVAQVIHASGPRALGPFIEINCAGIPETLLESELFGFMAGAFTDAKRAKPGLFEAASGGTLLLDEVDTLPLGLQSKLLTIIEAKRVRRLGAVAERAMDVKLIAATQVDLRRQAAEGRLRADMYYRLTMVVLTLPPLRERGEDVVLLAHALLRQYAAAHGVMPKRLSRRAEPWRLTAGWQQAIMEEARGFGGLVLQCSPALLIVVFALPEGVAQLSQRAVQAALAIRQLGRAARFTDGARCPEVRLGVHVGAVLVEGQAQDLRTRLVAVGETLALPVRLLGQAGLAEILVSPEVGQLLQGWAVLKAREWRLRVGGLERLGAYAVVSLG
jgi:MoxR-like ATPase